MQTETDVMNLCRMAAQNAGFVLWRNNVGALKDVRGVPVRFGLANDSAKINKVLKSSDLIGLGGGGRLLAVECKEPGWHWHDTPEERAQLAFIHEVRRRGGLAGFASRPEHALDIFRGGWGST
jgi:hypothetical protein